MKGMKGNKQQKDVRRGGECPSNGRRASNQGGVDTSREKAQPQPKMNR